MAGHKNDDRGCPHGLCEHSLIVHVEIVEGYGPARRVTWGRCSVCTSHKIHGEPGFFPCANPNV